MISSFLKVTQSSENCQPKSQGSKEVRVEESSRRDREEKLHEEMEDREGDGGENMGSEHGGGR